MNRKEMRKIPKPRTISINSEIFSPLVAYDGEEGTLPEGAIVIISGTPGTGKTRFLIQLLENIATFNTSKPSLYEYEMGPSHTVQLLDTLQSTLIDDVTFTKDLDPTKHVIGIDSVDFWAQNILNKSFAQREDAARIQNMAQNGTTVFAVQHLTKNKRSRSGSVAWGQISDIHIELIKQKDGTVLATTRSKNRWPSNIDQIVLEHTPNGLARKRNLTPMDYFKNFYTRMMR